MIKVMLIDDEPEIRRLLERMVEKQPDYQVVSQSGDFSGAVVDFTKYRPDVVFMDYAMPAMNGAETSERALALCPDLKIITLSMFGDNAYYSRMVSSGAKGFLLKDSEFDEVVEAVETVHAGGTYFSASLLKSLSHSIRSAAAGGDAAAAVAECDRLSDREVEILVAICQGLSTQEIADRLFISKRTVDKHRANILEKSGCKNTASLVVYAIRHRLVEV